MEKKISYVIFKLIYFIDNFVFKITKKSFLKWFTYFIEKESYEELLIENKKLILFSPNHLIKWRVNTFYTKEPETLDWINKFINKNPIVFWDIGANIGLYSLYAALKHKNCEVISFEPSTSNLRTLSRNIFVNNLSERVKIFSNPLQNNSNQNKFLEMNEKEFIEGHALNTFGENKNFEGKKFLPKMKYNIFGTSINFLLDNKFLKIPDYIKIDVDGIEHLILDGGNKYLNNKNIKSIIIEVNENYVSQYNNIMKTMKNLGFNIFEKKQTDEIAVSETQNKFSNTFNYIFKR
jgi:FkbM family methyltransferase